MVTIIVESPNLEARAYDMLLHGGRTSDLELLRRVAQLAPQRSIEVVFVRVTSDWDRVEMKSDHILSALENGLEFRET